MAESHVYVVASGFGLRVIPAASPYELALGPEPDQLDVECWIGNRHLFARVTAAQGSYSSRIGDGTTALHEVADVVAGPGFTSWWLETSVYRIPLPQGWRALASGETGQPSMFDLVNADGALIYIQTPKNLPPLDGMVGPGQKVHERGTGPRSRWVEVRYHHEHVDWSQRHDIVELGAVTCVITTQSPVSVLASVVAARDALVNDIARTDA